MKKFSKILILLLTLTAAALAVAACSSVRSVAIESTNMPQTVFVQGQDLDLSGGILTVTSDKDVEEIALDAPGVRVSGYDKNTLGEQTLTVSYEGKSTSLTVKVVPRMTAEKIESQYFAGEAFDATKGRLLITRNDGTSFPVPLTDEALTIEFDSSTAADPCTVKARYQKAGENYSGTFDVTVYAVEKATLNKPNNCNYKSHDTGINLAGGYIMLQNSRYQKPVALTQDMISGFNLKAATEANRTTPLTQTVTVSYAGQTLTFDVTIKYSDVSYIRQSLKDLNEIDWSGDALPTITKAQGDKAVELAGLYLGMPDNDKVLITVEEQTAIVRTAVVYGYEQWTAAVAAQNNVLEIAVDEKSASNYLAIKTTATQPQANTAYSALSADTGLDGLVALLCRLARDYGGATLFKEDTVDAYLSAVTGYEDVMAALGFALELNTALEGVEGWEADNSAQNAKIKNALDLIAEKGDVDDAAYKLVASWWADGSDTAVDDLFNVFYVYCWQENYTTALEAIASVYLPAPFDEFVVYAYYGTYYAMLTEDTCNSTGFMRYYYKLMQIRDDINGTAADSQEQWLYANLGCEKTLQQLQLLGYQDSQAKALGYYARIGAALYDADVENLWGKYLALQEDFSRALTEKNPQTNQAAQEAQEAYFKEETTKTLVKEMFETFAALSSSQQNAFLSSLDVRYASNSAQYPIFAYNNLYKNNFVAFIVNGYGAILDNDNAGTALQNLLVAIEAQSLGSSSAFSTYLGKVALAYEGDVKTVLDNAGLGAVYGKYKTISQYTDIDLSKVYVTGDSGETWKDVFDALAKALSEVRLGAGNNLYSPMISSFEYAETLLAKIEAAEKRIQDAYYYQNYVKVTVSQTQYYLIPMEMYYYSMRSTYMSYMALSGGMESWSENLKTAFAASRYVMWTYVYKDVSFDTEPENAETVKNAMTAFHALTEKEQLLFMAVDSKNIYHLGVTAFFNVVLTGEENGAAKQTATALVNAERAYVLYRNNNEGKYTDGTTFKEVFMENMAKVEAAWASLTTEDQAYLQEMYTTYHTVYEEMKAAETTPEQEAA